MNSYTIKRINTQESFCVSLTEGKLELQDKEGTVAFNYHLLNNTLRAESLHCPSFSMALAAVEALFLEHNEISEISLNNQHLYLRETFFQMPGIWNIPSNPDYPLENWVTTNQVCHPKRAAFFPGQQLYSRYVKTINAHVSFRVIREDDLDTFHEWHNQARVSNFWELGQSKEELKNYIIKGLKDPHQMPVIAEINNEPAGYFEFYWVKEDRLGPYYDSEAFDRGFHLLVGNKKYLGFKNTDALLKSASHFVFIDDPRTRKIMGEPRHDNQKLLKYLLHFKSWRKIKEFDFPHKRAALLECNRELFFQGHYL